MGTMSLEVWVSDGSWTSLTRVSRRLAVGVFGFFKTAGLEFGRIGASEALEGWKVEEGTRTGRNQEAPSQRQSNGNLSVVRELAVKRRFDGSDGKSGGIRTTQGRRKVGVVQVDSTDGCEKAHAQENRRAGVRKNGSPLAFQPPLSPRGVEASRGCGSIRYGYRYDTSWSGGWCSWWRMEARVR